jgi:nucleoid-associated protein YgaU
MDPAVKIAMALCVLLAGVCSSMLFHRDKPRTKTPVAIVEQPLLIPTRPAVPAKPPRPVVVAPPAAATLTLKHCESPPMLAAHYPASDRPANSRWGTSMDMMLPAGASTDKTPQNHRIVDGDTLAALAERYLGSAARAKEIFEANREVLSDPALLPIGAELKIPPK